MRVLSTSDVPLKELRAFAGELVPEIDIDVNTRQVFLRSAEPPSWVTLLAQADWWVQVLAGYAALYVAELVKEAAKETWRQRSKGLVAATAVAGPLRRLAGALAGLRGRLLPKTTVGVGLPLPDEHFSTRLALEGDDPDGLLVQLALFVHHVPAIRQTIATHGLADGKATTGVLLRLQDDGSLLISWHDSGTLEIREQAIPLRKTV